MGRRVQDGMTELADQPFDRTKMAMANRDHVADAAHEALFQLGNRPPHEALLGAGVLVATLCSRLGVAEDELMRMARRVLKVEPHQKKVNDSLQSLRDFASIRMAGVETTIS